MTTATKDQVSERVISALVEFGEEPENVKPDSRFEDLDIDSLDQVIEDEYTTLFRSILYSSSITWSSSPR